MNGHFAALTISSVQDMRKNVVNHYNNSQYLLHIKFGVGSFLFWGPDLFSLFPSPQFRYEIFGKWITGLLGDISWRSLYRLLSRYIACFLDIIWIDFSKLSTLWLPPLLGIYSERRILKEYNWNAHAALRLFLQFRKRQYQLVHSPQWVGERSLYTMTDCYLFLD